MVFTFSIFLSQLLLIELYTSAIWSLVWEGSSVTIDDLQWEHSGNRNPYSHKSFLALHCTRCRCLPTSWQLPFMTSHRYLDRTMSLFGPRRYHHHHQHRYSCQLLFTLHFKFIFYNLHPNITGQADIEAGFGDFSATYGARQDSWC